MPPAVVAAGIAGAAALGGGALAARGANRATSAGERSTQAALQFEREREAARKAEFEAQQAAYKEQYDAWLQQRNALLRRYGVNIPGTTDRGGVQGKLAAFGALPQSERVVRGGVPPVPTKPLSLGAMIQQGAAAAPGAPPGTEMIPVPPQGPPEGVFNWQDWKNYGA